MVAVETPVERHGDYLVKRDDLYERAGMRGGKVRTCAALCDAAVRNGYPGVVTAGARSSPQVAIVAHLARDVGLACRAHVPDGAPGPELVSARAAGAELVAHRPGYNSVIVARARQDAASRGWAEVPFGMECREAVRQTSAQVDGLPDVPRIVVAVGSGMSLAGILDGLARTDRRDVPVLGVVVGADPTKRLDHYAPAGWQKQTTLVRSALPYSRRAPVRRIDDLELDPIYEAKTLPYLFPDDLLWVVGIRGAGIL